MDDEKTYTWEEVTEFIERWAKSQEVFANSKFVEKKPSEAYKQALKHLRHFIKRPITEYI